MMRYSWLRPCLLLPLITLVAAGGTLEAVSLLATKAGLLLFNEPPGNHYGQRWRNEREPWGGWHKANAIDRHVTQCFDVIYRSNSIGARDEEFSPAATPGRRRAILLGDSFAEGYGVDIGSASQTFIEEFAGVDVLNFGSAGETGPVHYYLLYQRLARQFEHDTVILYFLPATDFRDNDYAAWQDVPDRNTRYRPYWKRIGADDFDVFYPPAAVPSKDVYDGYPGGTWGAIKWFVNEYSWSKNTLRTMQYLLSGRPDARAFSGYFDAPAEQQQAAIFFLRQLIRVAGDRHVVIVAIPDQRDIRALRGSRRQVMDQFWYRELQILSQSVPSVTFVDLAQHLPSDVTPLFLPCDPHWSAAGNQWAGAIVSRYVAATGRGPS